MRVIPNSSSSLSFKNLVTEGSTTVSSYNSAGYGSGDQNLVGGAPGNGATSGIYNTTELYFPNYSNTSANKSYYVDTVNATVLWFWTAANLLSSTSAITSLSITCNSYMSQYSTAYLYGIKNS
jgi:hypothetical protein